MSKFKEIGGATINYGIGKYIPQLIGFFLIPIYTRYLKEPSEYGIVEMATSFLGFAMIFMRFALPGSVSRFYFEHKEGPELRNYITTIYWSVMTISVVMAGLTYLISYFFIDVLMPGLPLHFVSIVLITGILGSNSEIQKRLLQARKKSAYSAILNIVTALFTIGTALLLITVFNLKALGFLVASLIGALVFFIQAQVYLRKEMGGKFSFKLLKPSLKYSVNILPSHLVTPFGDLLSRSLLAGAAAWAIAGVGLYSLALRFVTPLYILGDAFSTAFLPIYFEARKEDSSKGYRKLEEACKKIWLIAVFLFVGAGTIGPPLIYLITPEAYHPAAGLIPLMAISFLPSILTIMHSPEIYYSKKTWWVTVIAITRFTSNVIIAILFVNKIGYYALILAKFIENVIIMSFSIYVSRKMFNFNPNFPLIIKTCLIGLALVGVHMFFAEYLQGKFIQMLAGFALMALFGGILIATNIVNITTLKSYLKLNRL